MPEEQNRVVTDHLATLHFVTDRVDVVDPRCLNLDDLYETCHGTTPWISCLYV